MVRLGINERTPGRGRCAPLTRAPACCALRRTWRIRLALVLSLLALAVAPRLARPEPLQPAEAAPELVAEALFLCDPVPPGAAEASLAMVLRPREAGGGPAPDPYPRLQLALALSDRLGLTVDVGLVRDQGRVVADAPGASLKLLLLDPAGGRTGLAASLDLFGSTHSLAAAEVGLGIGALRAFGPVTARASLSAATTTGRWGPHLHAGASAAVALWSRARAFAEVVADLGGGRRALAAGPTLKVLLAARTTLAAGALIPIGAGASPLLVTVLLTQGI